MTDDDEVTAVYPRAWARAIATMSLDDPEQWPPLDAPPPPESGPEGADMCDAFMAIFGFERVR